MGKIKTSVKHERSSKKLKTTKPFNIETFSPVKIKKGLKLTEHNPDTFLKNPKLVREALTSAFFDGDVNAFKEILAAHLRATSKDELSKKTGVSRATVFRMLDSGSNPSFENVAKVVSHLKKAV